MYHLLELVKDTSVQMSALETTWFPFYSLEIGTSMHFSNIT